MPQVLTTDNIGYHVTTALGVESNNLEPGSQAYYVDPLLYEVSKGTLVYDDFTYTTVIIGDQEWTVENLRTTKFYTGVEIPKVTDNAEWVNLGYTLKQPGYCAYNNDENNVPKNGYLYNIHAVNTGKLAPAGWRVPTDEDWKTLERFLGLTEAEINIGGARGTAALRLQKIGEGPATTDDYGFSAVMAGHRHASGGFTGLNTQTKFWAAGSAVNSRILYDTNVGIYRQTEDDRHGHSVRLVRNVPTKSTLVYNGFTYTTVRIGNQEWTVENLRTTKYNDGLTNIPNITDGNDWTTTTSDAYCAYNNDESNVETYGYLYNWYAVNTGALAPAGWRVPTDEDWKILEKYLGMSEAEANDIDWRGTDEGGKLKATGTTHWTSPNTGATNSSGFSALPGGRRWDYNVNPDGDETFASIGDLGGWWSSTIKHPKAWTRYLLSGNQDVTRKDFGKTMGYSVRLVRTIPVFNSLKSAIDTSLSLEKPVPIIVSGDIDLASPVNISLGNKRLDIYLAPGCWIHSSTLTTGIGSLITVNNVSSTGELNLIGLSSKPQAAVIGGDSSEEGFGALQFDASGDLGSGPQFWLGLYNIRFQGTGDNLIEVDGSWSDLSGVYAKNCEFEQLTPPGELDYKRILYLSLPNKASFYDCIFLGQQDYVGGEYIFYEGVGLVGDALYFHNCLFLTGVEPVYGYGDIYDGPNLVAVYGNGYGSGNPKVYFEKCGFDTPYGSYAVAAAPDSQASQHWAAFYDCGYAYTQQTTNLPGVTLFADSEQITTGTYGARLLMHGPNNRYSSRVYSY